MRLSVRLNLSLILGVTVVSLALALNQTRTEVRGLRQELERHAVVLAESLEKSAAPLITSHSLRELQRLVDTFQNHERLAGVAVYDIEGRPLAITSDLAARVHGSPAAVAQALRGQGGAGEYFRLTGKPMHVFAKPIQTDTAPIGALAIFHDASYINAQAADMWRHALAGMLIETVLIVCVTLLILHWSLRRPLARLTVWLRDQRTGSGASDPEHPPDLPEEETFQPFKREVARLATTLNMARAAAEEEARLRNAGESLWTPERLRISVQGKLGASRLFAISNREPYEHFRRGNTIECSVPASGLVTALEPILRACDGTWIAQGTGDADREMVDERDRLRVPPDNPQYTLRRVWLTPEEEQGFYFGFANEGLWPLCHMAHTRPTFRALDWEHYRNVNQRFAAALLEEIAAEDHPVVLVQDYHFALAPRIIKRARPDARVAIFWHIPWPNPEAFGICPWQPELLDGLLGADLIGFHIQSHCNNFLDTIDRTLEARVDRERFAVNLGGHLTRVRPFPISVSFTEEPEDREPAYWERAEILAALGVDASMLGIGVDRVDYTKGIPERLRAIELFFEKCPVYRGHFTFVQIGAPSRTHIQRYHDLLKEVESEVERINRRFQTGDWKPIVFLARHHSHKEILTYYRLADVCMVTSLHDGMNLVAKEFVAARYDEQGALILSPFAGASHELVDALVVNPYDTEGLADAIRRALEMAPEEKQARMSRMRAYVREHNIYRWAGNLVAELAALRLDAPEQKPEQKMEPRPDPPRVEKLETQVALPPARDTELSTGAPVIVGHHRHALI